MTGLDGINRAIFGQTVGVEAFHVGKVGIQHDYDKVCRARSMQPGCIGPTNSQDGLQEKLAK